MVKNILHRVIGSRNDRLLRRYRRTVAAVNELESDMRGRDDAALAAVTEALRARRAAGEPVEALIPEVFAAVREAGRRALEMRHFDVQLIGGLVLHEGRIAEMRTGEGKTLVATLAACLNALDGDGVHIVTVNDYLARRDADWMGGIYRLLGMTVGVVTPGQTPREKREAYRADVVYGTNNEFGFDYLRDNMAFSLPDKAQGRLGYAIVDEVDSILIDEARTPLIISGPSEESSELYQRINHLIPKLERREREPEEGEEDVPGDYSVDEKTRQTHLTEIGYRKVEELLGEEGLLREGESLYDTGNVMLLHHFDAALRAHALYHRDVHYLVRGGEVVIVDEFTGRTMPGRRWSDGLHQAVEAKEGVNIRQENQTLASITFQNYFRLYGKLGGMTGTADTEAAEFQQIYGLEVVVVPTHLPMIREDRADLVYLKKEEKVRAIVEEIAECREHGQPVLVGTASIEASEDLSGRLRRENVPHQVLNAKQHESEAQIIAQAGKPGTVTIATNMAGRGTDIVLGGNWRVEFGEDADDRLRAAWQEGHDAVVAAGGLHIVGTERHESRRIDNQLRGRSGRQGDPGSSRFFLSLEDDLMRIFAAERVSGLMQKLGVEEGEAIEHRWVTKAIENAQRKVEGRNFDIRKQLLEYDDVANDQRREIYALRDELMSTEDVSEMYETVRSDVVNAAIDAFIPPETLDELWDVPGLARELETEFGLSLDLQGWLDADDELHEEPLRRRILDAFAAAHAEKEKVIGSETMRAVEKAVMLQVLDTIWKEHLAAMDYLRQGIHLRGYAQKNPKQEYKRESFEMFRALLDRFKSEVVKLLSRGEVRPAEDPRARAAPPAPPVQVEYSHAGANAFAPEEEMAAVSVPSGGTGDGMGVGLGTRAGPPEAPPVQPFVRGGRKVGRNEPCPCGSGRKYKHCHGRLG